MVVLTTVTFHRKTYTNAFPLNGLNGWQSIGYPLGPCWEWWKKRWKCWEKPLKNLLGNTFHWLTCSFLALKQNYIRSCNTGVAGCGSFCSLNVKLLRNQSWENLCFQTRSSTRFSIKSSRFSITGSRFSMKGSRFSKLDSRRNRESSRESRLATDCQLTFERYCKCPFQNQTKNSSF